MEKGSRGDNWPTNQAFPRRMTVKTLCVLPRVCVHLHMCKKILKIYVAFFVKFSIHLWCQWLSNTMMRRASGLHTFCSKYVLGKFLLYGQGLTWFSPEKWLFTTNFKNRKMYYLAAEPLPSIWQHLLSDDCLEDKREGYQNCRIVYHYTYMN